MNNLGLSDMLATKHWHPRDPHTCQHPWYMKEFVCGPSHVHRNSFFAVVHEKNKQFYLHRMTQNQSVWCVWHVSHWALAFKGPHTCHHPWYMKEYVCWTSHGRRNSFFAVINEKNKQFYLHWMNQNWSAWSVSRMFIRFNLKSHGHKKSNKI